MRRARFASGLLLLSGAAALICETLWVKQLSRVVGVEIHAVTIALSAFFAGLAIGSVVFGRMADRSARPLRLYAALEMCAAGLGLVATLALRRVAPLYVSLQDSVGSLAWWLPSVLVAVTGLLHRRDAARDAAGASPGRPPRGTNDWPSLRGEYDGRGGR